MKKIIGILFSLTVLGLGGLFYLDRIHVKEKMGPTDSQKTFQEILTKWVYQKSKVISRRACQNIVVEAMRYDHPLLILAICEVESQGFQPSALSSKEARGLGQIMATEKTHLKALIKAGIIQEPRDLFDIDTNIRATAYLLENQFLPKANGEILSALKAYLGEHDGAYAQKIMVNLSNLYILTSKGGKKNEN